MKGHDITAALRKEGSSHNAIARELEINQVAVSMVIAGESREPKIERHIAHVTGYSLAQLWPQWHAAESNLEQSRDLMAAIPARLIAERERLELTPHQTAVLGCITPELLASYECGAITPSALFLARLARSTHFDALYVITGRRESGLGR